MEWLECSRRNGSRCWTCLVLQPINRSMLDAYTKAKRERKIFWGKFPIIEVWKRLQKLYKKLILYCLVFFIFSLWLEIQNRLFSQTDHHQRPKFLPFKASNLSKKSRQNITSMQWEFLCWQAAHKALYFSFIFGENSLAEIKPHLYFFLIFVWLKCWDAGKYCRCVKTFIWQVLGDNWWLPLVI